MLVWLQHCDFSSDEFPDASLDIALEQFNTFDWQAELDKQKSAEQQYQKYCNSGIGLVRGDTHIIHLCPESPETASVFYHYKQPTKALGIIPYLSSETLHAHEFPMGCTRELFEAHFANKHTTTLLLLGKYS